MKRHEPGSDVPGEREVLRSRQLCHHTGAVVVNPVDDPSDAALVIARSPDQNVLEQVEYSLLGPFGPCRLG